MASPLQSTILQQSQKEMRVPGIQGIAFTQASNINAELELQALSGISPDITAIQFTAISFVGAPTLELSDSNENNGSNQHASLTFVMEGSFRERKVAFVVTAANGAIYLIGSCNAIPSITTKDITDNPSTANRTEVTIEITSPIAWMTVNGRASISPELPWREITKEEIDEIINNL